MATAIDETYQIPKPNLERLQEKITQLNKKAGELGTDPLTFEVLDAFQEKDENGVIRKYVNVHIEGVAPVLEGWRFIGKISHRKDAGIVRSVHGSIPEAFRDRGNVCDHCGYNRYRKNTFVVENTESGEYMQVGSTCIKDFIDGHNINKIASYFSRILDEIEHIESEYGSYPEDLYYFDLTRYLAYVLLSISEWGWTSKSRCGPDETPTCDHAVYLMLKQRSLVPSDAKYEEAERIIEWGKSLQERDTLDEFLHNVSEICRQGEVHWRDLGYAAATVVAYRRDRQKQRRQKQVSEHFGEIGDRDEYHLTLVFQTGFETRWGWLSLFKFVDGEGNVAVWKTSSEQDLDTGQRYRVKATIKDHSDYQGTKQTVLKRCYIKDA